MKTILVPVDFSSASRNASEFAALLAKQHGAALFLLHVYTVAMPVTEGSMPFATMCIELQEEFGVRIQKETKRLIEKYGVQATCKIMIGFKGDVIKKMAEEVSAGLICLGRKQRSQKPLLGSMILKAVQKTDIPVMVIPKESIYQPMKRIVLAVDYKEMLHYDCLSPLFSIVNSADVVLSVLHIQKGDTELAADEVPEKLQLGYVLPRIHYLYEKIEDNNVENGILKFIGSHSTDLLVMIAHRHNLFGRLFGDVHTAPMAFEINIPLLILKNEPNQG